ncbi:hypothetical protein [Streptomyces sp. NPDC059455]|uniref:hypothetical protein n=1 Tax=Streptomyces sp. NPDC059455 TaxID=3346837 RepID=UPI00368D5C82
MHIGELVGTGEWHTVEGRPYVVYKYATTLDGRIAAADSTSQATLERSGPNTVRRNRS